MKAIYVISDLKVGEARVFPITEDKYASIRNSVKQYANRVGKKYKTRKYTDNKGLFVEVKRIRKK